MRSWCIQTPLQARLTVITSGIYSIRVRIGSVFGSEMCWAISVIFWNGMFHVWVSHLWIFDLWPAAFGKFLSCYCWTLLLCKCLSDCCPGSVSVIVRMHVQCFIGGPDCRTSPVNEELFHITSICFLIMIWDPGTHVIEVVKNDRCNLKRIAMFFRSGPCIFYARWERMDEIDDGMVAEDVRERRSDELH